MNPKITSSFESIEFSFNCDDIKKHLKKNNITEENMTEDQAEHLGTMILKQLTK